MRSVIFLLFLIILHLHLTTPVLAQTHPFLLVQMNQFATLQARASQEPFAGMKTRAIAECTQRVMSASPTASCNGSLDPNLYPTMATHSYCMRAIMSSCALAYIIDPGNRINYLNKVIQTMPYWENIISVQSGADDGTRNSSNEYYTDATSAAFNTILAIDIMYPDLTTRSRTGQFSTELAYAEFLMDQEYNHFYGITLPVYNFILKDGSTLAYHSPSRHPPAREAFMSLWKLYRNNFNYQDSDSRALIFGGMLNNEYPDLDGDGKNIEGYMPEMAARVNASGTYTEGSAYAYAAWGLDRDERAHLIDVLEFTGKDQEFNLDFYTDNRFQSFYEWLYGYASTPFGMMTSFGDTYAFRLLTDDGHGGNSWTTSSHIGQASRFTPNAGDYATWKSRGEPQQGRLLNYLLYSPSTGQARPTSRIFQNGGGFFMSQPVDDQSLYGALWSVTEPNEGSVVFHVRKDSNALYLAAYGAPLLMNGGFCGSSSPAGPDGCFGTDENGTGYRFSGTYLGDRAVSNNVGLVNYAVGTDVLTPLNDNQTTNFGSGIIEGFTGQNFDYASSAYSGYANDGNHQRNLLFIHPSPQNQGYFAVFDEFIQINQGPVHLVFHPNASSRQVVTNLTEYTLPVGRRAFADASTALTLFFGTQPQAINFYRGIIATAGSIGAFVPEYFFNTYSLTGNAKNITTILFPHNATHLKPPMTRLSGTNYTGTRLDHTSTLQDFALESSGSTAASPAGLTFQAKAVWYRLQNNSLTSYFARQARTLTNNANPAIGFSATQNISLYLNGAQGNIVSPGTSVTFRYPGITGVRLNNQNLTGTPANNTFTTTIPAGTHTLNLVAGTPPPPEPPDFIDLLDLIRQFGQIFNIFNFNSLVSQF